MRARIRTEENSKFITWPEGVEQINFRKNRNQQSSTIEKNKRIIIKREEKRVKVKEKSKKERKR